MNTRPTLMAIILLISVSLSAQQQSPPMTLQDANKVLPHKFKELKTGATLEAVRGQRSVTVYMLIDDIEQYDEILVERSDEQMNFGQCKVIKIEKGKYPNNYLEIVDNYPLPTKVSNVYRIKAVTSEGIMRMFPAVPITYQEEPKAKK